MLFPQKDTTHEEPGFFYIFHRMNQHIYFGISGNIYRDLLNMMCKLETGLHDNEELQGYYNHYSNHLVYIHERCTDIGEAKSRLKALIDDMPTHRIFMNGLHQLRVLNTDHPSVAKIKSDKYLTENMMYENEELLNDINRSLKKKLFFRGKIYNNLTDAMKANELNEEAALTEMMDHNNFWLEEDGSKCFPSIDQEITIVNLFK